MQDQNEREKKCNKKQTTSKQRMKEKIAIHIADSVPPEFEPNVPFYAPQEYV